MTKWSLFALITIILAIIFFRSLFNKKYFSESVNEHKHQEVETDFISSKNVEAANITASGTLLSSAESNTAASKEESDRKTTQPEVNNEIVVPEIFRDFYTYSPERQLDFVTELESQYALPREVIIFLMAAVQNKKLNEVTRNNIANTLLNQNNREPSLCEIFIGMINDKLETNKWRDYAIQHLGVSINNGHLQESAFLKLLEIASSETGGLRGTAMRQLNMIEKSGAVKLEDDYTDLLVTMAEGESEDLSCRMTAISLIGERRERKALKIIRKLAINSDSSLRRTAIATLGKIGDAGDDVIIQDALKDVDPMVRLAAVGALKNRETQSP
jgi:HEAT repeats